MPPQIVQDNRVHIKPGQRMKRGRQRHPHASCSNDQHPAKSMTRRRRERGVPPLTSLCCMHNRSKESAGTCERRSPQRRRCPHCPGPPPRHPRAVPHIPTYRRQPPEKGTRATKPLLGQMVVDSHSRPPLPTPAATRPGGGAEQAGQRHPYRAESFLQPRIGPSGARSPPPPSPVLQTCPAATSGEARGGERGKGGWRRGARVSPPDRLEGRHEGVGLFFHSCVLADQVLYPKRVIDGFFC
jgi:hypothetical protein